MKCNIIAHKMKVIRGLILTCPKVLQFLLHPDELHVKLNTLTTIVNKDGVLTP